MYTGLCAPCQGKFGVAEGISPTVSWGFLDLLLKALVKMLHSCSLKQIQSATIPSHLPHQRGSCKQISPAFVTYPAPFLMQLSLCSVEL